jgi:hypothetical protein
MERKNPAELPRRVEQRGRNREEAVRNRVDANAWHNAVKQKVDIFSPQLLFFRS